ncbi:hypothetical protein GCM10009624_29050 [Gordonia sinesedis]
MADTNEYAYDPVAAQAAEDRVETAATNLQGAVDELRDQIQRLASSWQGDEHDAFSGVQTKVMNGFESITQVLSQIKQAVGDNTQQVMTMQRKIQNTIQSG